MLQEILEQEITPELVPQKQSDKPQATEDSVGPYALQDLTLFYVLRTATARARSPSWPGTPGATPRRGSGRRTFPSTGASPTTWRRSGSWMVVFVNRFFASQFKRSALPNGPKVSAGGTMSPRGDWRMPSDASAAAWLAELERTCRRTDREQILGRPRLSLRKGAGAHREHRAHHARGD